MIQFGDLSKLFAPEQTNETSPELFLYQLLANKRLNGTFPNVEISLRMNVSCSDGGKVQNDHFLN